MKKGIIIIDRGFEFIRPYVQAALEAGTLVHTVFPDADAPDVAVMLSTTDVYAPGKPTVLAGENSAVDPAHPRVKAEQDFLAECACRGIRGVVLRCAPVVGTGMDGFVRNLASDIWRGIFFHFPGNDTRMSVVHATDVAAAIRKIAEGADVAHGTVLNLTDGANPTLHDLAEALAFRMNEKRISTLSTRPQQMIGRWLYGPKYRAWTTERTFDGSAACRILGLTPTPVCDYLRTHTYDETSL